MSLFWAGYVAGFVTPLVASALLLLVICIPEIRDARARKKATKKYLAVVSEWERNFHDGNLS